MDENTNAMNKDLPFDEDRVRHMAELEDRLHSADHESPEEIRREIERTRREIDYTVSCLKNRIEWEELANDAFDSVKRTWREKQPDVMGSVKRNPGPTALTALGLGWMLLRGVNDGQLESQLRHKMGEKTENLKHRIGEKASHAKERLGQRASHMRDRISETGHEFRSTAGETSGEVGQKAREIGDRVRGKFQNVKERTGERVHGRISSARESGMHAMHRAQEGVADSYQSNPMAMGVLAMAVGAAFGMSLPLTQQEERVIDKAGEGLKDVTQNLTQNLTQAFGHGTGKSSSDMGFGGSEGGFTDPNTTDSQDLGV